MLFVIYKTAVQVFRLKRLFNARFRIIIVKGLGLLFNSYFTNGVCSGICNV